MLIDVLRRRPEAIEFLRQLPERPHCSEVSRTEVIRGLRSAERGPAELLFARVHWRRVDEAVARRAGAFGRQYRTSHAAIGVADLLIAATADLFGLDLATPNVRHFPMFAHLQPPY